MLNGAVTADQPAPQIDVPPASIATGEARVVPAVTVEFPATTLATTASSVVPPPPAGAQQAATRSKRTDRSDYCGGQPDDNTDARTCGSEHRSTLSSTAAPVSSTSTAKDPFGGVQSAVCCDDIAQELNVAHEDGLHSEFRSLSRSGGRRPPGTDSRESAMTTGRIRATVQHAAREEEF